jgi:hypothetical protein
MSYLIKLSFLLAAQKILYHIVYTFFSYQLSTSFSSAVYVENKYFYCYCFYLLISSLHVSRIKDLPRLHSEKGSRIFSSPAGMSLTKLSLAVNNLITHGNPFLVSQC